MTPILHLLDEMFRKKSRVHLNRTEVEDLISTAMRLRDAEIERLRDDRDQWKSIADEGRKAGREEAFQIVFAEDPEDLFVDAMRSHEIGDTGEWGTTWNEQKLREKFDVQPGATQSIIDRADEFYWSTREEVDRVKAKAARLNELDAIEKASAILLKAEEFARCVHKSKKKTGPNGLPMITDRYRRRVLAADAALEEARAAWRSAILGRATAKTSTT